MEGVCCSVGVDFDADGGMCQGVGLEVAGDPLSVGLMDDVEGERGAGYL